MQLCKISVERLEAQWSGSSLVKVMAWVWWHQAITLTNADLLCVGRPMLTYCALDDQCWFIVRWTTNADLLCVGRPMLTYCALDDQCWLIVRWTTNADLLCVGRPMLTYCALDDQCWLIVRWTTNADLLCVGHLRPLLPTEISTLRPRQNRCHFADAIFKCVFLNENAWIALKISLKFVPAITYLCPHLIWSQGALAMRLRWNLDGIFIKTQTIYLEQMHPWKCYLQTLFHIVQNAMCVEKCSNEEAFPAMQYSTCSQGPDSI